MNFSDNQPTLVGGDNALHDQLRSISVESPAIAMQEWVHQLIVIGNGFDLACGLRSNYSDFFTDLPSAILPDPGKITEQNWGMYLRERGYTVWDVILCHYHPMDQWCNVEKHIGEWIAEDTPDSALDHVDKVLAVLRGNGHIASPQRTMPANWRYYAGSLSRDFPELDVARFLHDTHPDHVGGGWTRQLVFDALLDELHLLEMRFSKYLEAEVESSKDYCARSHSLLSRLKEVRTSPQDYQYDTSILSFNYTMPWEYGPSILEGSDQPVCIHGCLLDGDIIFGIDGTDCMGDAEAVPFTKTYRVMALDTGDVGEIIRSVSDGHREATSLIKFFGHSLSKADYAYFQALFDAVDLYGGSTTLVFYYRPHGADADSAVDDARERESMMRRVTELLVAYGKTLDNGSHGRNLIHRLLLEGRLHVQRI